MRNIDDIFEFEKLSFIGTIILGAVALLGMVIACAIANNAQALGLALAASGIAYLAQVLVTWEMQASREPGWFVECLSICSVLAWIAAGTRLLYVG